MKNKLLLLSFLLGGIPLLSQQLYTVTDSTITYTYASLTDSILSEKNVKIESVSNDEDISSLYYTWDAIKNDWVSDRKNGSSNHLVPV